VCPIFKDIGQKLGPFDMSFVPIWRGGTLGFISHLGLRLSHNDIPSALHASPVDAIDIHNDVSSKNTVAVHFGTFVGSENESLEAVMEFEEGRQNRGVLNLDEQPVAGRGRAGIVDIGGSVAVEIDVHDAPEQSWALQQSIIITIQDVTVRKVKDLTVVYKPNKLEIWAVVTTEVEDYLTTEY
jgi:N-acyl-phosphatidylethanolamine-hydrolysing phospholipase D